MRVYILINDKAIEYKSLIHKIDVMLINIEKLGIDISIYLNIFNDIINEEENITVESKNKNYSSMFLEQDYTKGISKLKQLEIYLQEYDIYFKALKETDYLSVKLGEENTSNEIKKYIQEVISILNLLKLSKTLHYSEEEKIVEKVYKTIYDLINLEIITFGYSELYNYCKDNETDVYFLDKLIRKQLENLNLKEEKYKKIIETYSIYGNDKKEEYVDKKTKDKVYLKEYGVYEKHNVVTSTLTKYDYTRTVKTYDVTHIDLSEFNDLANLDIDRFNLRASVVNNNISKYNEPYFVLEKISVGNKENEYFDEERFNGFIFLFYIFYILILLFYEKYLSFGTSYISLYNNITELLNTNLFFDKKIILKI